MLQLPFFIFSFENISDYFRIASPQFFDRFSNGNNLCYFWKKNKWTNSKNSCKMFESVTLKKSNEWYLTVIFNRFVSSFNYKIMKIKRKRRAAYSFLLIISNYVDDAFAKNTYATFYISRLFRHRLPRFPALVSIAAGIWVKKYESTLTVRRIVENWPTAVTPTTSKYVHASSSSTLNDAATTNVNTMTADRLVE